MRKFFHVMAAAAAALTLSLSSSLAAWAGVWQFDGPENWQWKYVEDDGSLTTSTWKEIDGSWYHFDADGYLDTGIRYFDNDYPNYYYMNDTDGPDIGKMMTSGQWEYGYIQEDGLFHCYYPNYADPFTASGEILLYDPGTFDESTQFSAVVGVSTRDWYNQLFVELESMLNWEVPEWQSVERQFQLPDNWRDECPLPFLDTMIGYSIGSTTLGLSDAIRSYQWNLVDGNTLTVQAYYYFPEQY